MGIDGGSSANCGTRNKRLANVENWERKHALPPAASYVLVGASLILGFFILALAIFQLWSTHKSRSWAQIKGVISESTWAPARSRHESGFAQITYQYSIGGQSYEGTNIFLVKMSIRIRSKERNFGSIRSALLLLFFMIQTILKTLASNPVY